MADDIDNKFNIVLGGFDKITNQLLIDLENRITEKTPVDTGDLRAGWKTEKETDSNGNIVSAEINNRVPYAPYVEFGTRKMAPRSMIMLSVEEVKEIY